MNEETSERANSDLRIIEELIDEHIQVACNLVLIDGHTWAIHATIAVDGEVIVAEFGSKADAEKALARIAAAEG
jgi:hypothetical protein